MKQTQYTFDKMLLREALIDIYKELFHGKLKKPQI